jgi:GDP-4-dehydro-6-deoxy-D-mannose reductase
VRVLITGVSGFVGRYLAASCLRDGLEVYGISRGPAPVAFEHGSVQWSAVDLLDRVFVRAVLERVRPETIFHLAAQADVSASWKDPADTLANNVIAEANVLQSLVDVGLNPVIVAVGSSECYGRVRPEENPIGELTPFRPANPYGVSKAAQDLLGQQYFASHGLRIVRMRPFNHIGPGQSHGFAVASFARQIAEIEESGAARPIRVGNLSAERDLSDVRDIVAGYRLAALHGKPGEAYNIGSGHGVTIEAVLKKLLALARTTIEVEVDPERLRPLDVPRIVCDPRKFIGDTGWQPHIPLDQSLADVLNSFRMQKG